MAKKQRDSSEKERHLGLVIEDIDDKFQIILEATAPIPKMQAQIEHILTWEEDVKMIRPMMKQMGDMQKQINHMLEWEEDIKLIPAIFEEVGSLRKDLEILKAAMKLLDRHDKRLETIEKRLLVLEQKVSL